jgi:tRNA dimethylallyltransferase
MSPAAPEALCLAGPTASGKSALALALAEALPLEIISVDSAQVYRGMDIGTAKPTAAERARVPHHLIDILDPTEAYSAARFVADAQRLVREIRARGRLPLLVGGTMLYFKALREGLAPMPPADATVRAAIDAEAAAQGWPALHAELARIDPATAARLAPRDSQRIQRALEVARVSGRPLSSWHAQGRSPGVAASWPLLSLEPDSRHWLHRRIAERFDQMMAAGFEGEVRALQSRAGLGTTLPSMRAVGYRQWWQALEGAPEGRLDAAARAAAREAGIVATRQLAKHQLTWLRSISSREVVPADADDALAQGLARLCALARCA